MMDDQPRKVLKELVQRYGPSLARDSSRTEGLLRDLCGSCQREIFILVSAIRARVPADLLAPRHTLSLPLLKEFLARRLEEELSFSAGAAAWAVESWAEALGLEGIPPSADTPAVPAPAALAEVVPRDEDPAIVDKRRQFAMDLESPSLETRLGAIAGIAEMPDGGAIVLLIGALENGNWQVREAAFDALTEKGGPAIPFLLEALGDPHETIVWRVVLVLGCLGTSEAVDSLLPLLNHGGVIRECALWALGECGDEHAAAALLAFLQDPDPCVSREAAEALEKIGKKRIGR